jgi:hypothetical protein
MINLNEMALEIAKKEGKVKQVNIAQIKEILKISLTLLYEKEVKDKGSVIKLLERHNKKNFRKKNSEKISE